MNCAHCNAPTSLNDKFCSSCGFDLHTQSTRSTEGGTASGKNAFADIANRINKIAGVENAVELKLRDVFSNVLKKHTEQDAERLFTVGTSLTTPDIRDVADTWPKPWLFARVFLLVAIVYCGLYLGFNTFENMNFLPGLIIMGAFMVPISMLIFFWEVNAPQNISIYSVIKMAFIGGVLSMVLAMVMYQSIGNASSVIIVAIVEEAAKVLALLWFLRNRRYKYIMNGLLIGAAIGAGFAAFETAGYALNAAFNDTFGSMYSTIFWRGVLSPGGHIVWAALSGAAICMVKGDKPFRWAMLKDFRFLRIFAIVVVLHALWDAPIDTASSIPFVQIILAIVAWIIAFSMMGMGLREISRYKGSELQTLTQEVTTIDG